MSGGLAKITKDVPPFTMVDGNPAAVRSLNIVGMQRRGFTTDDITALKTAYKKIFLKKTGNIEKAIKELSSHDAFANIHVQHLVEFISQEGRGPTR